MSLSVPSSLIGPAAAFVRDYMSRYDGSHDFGHIRRVVRLARHIHSQEHQRAGADLGVVILAALLHDVGDKKYVSEGEDPTCMVRDVLAGKLGAEPALAERVQKICLGVSYSSEAKDPEGTERLVQEYPECKALPSLFILCPLLFMILLYFFIFDESLLFKTSTPQL